MEKVSVDAQALRALLAALNGMDHDIREIQAISKVRGNECPIKILTDQWNDYNLAVATAEQEGIKPLTDSTDAERYRWLRNRDLDTISKGGVFAGMTPDNIILNGKDLDDAIDGAMLEGS